MTEDKEIKSTEVEVSSIAMPLVSSVASYRGPPREQGRLGIIREHALACHLRADGRIWMGSEEAHEPRAPFLLLLAAGERIGSHCHRAVEAHWCFFSSPGIAGLPGGRLRVALPGLQLERSHLRPLAAVEAREVLDLFRELRRNAASPEAASRIAAGARILDLLAVWARPVVADLNHSMVERYRAAIEAEACNERISLAAIASELGRSLDHIGSVFRRTYGMSPIEYRIRYRLLRGREALAGGAGVAEAARAAGFQDPRYFTRLFRRRYGATPTVFTQSRRRG
jgi:AraC-like DNA-binding protein